MTSRPLTQISRHDQKLMEWKYTGAKKVDSKVIKSPARLWTLYDKFLINFVGVS